LQPTNIIFISVAE